MSLNVILIPGFNWPAGSKITLETLRQSAKPSIQIEGSVAATEISDNSISATKLRSEPVFWATGDTGTDVIELSLVNPAVSLVNGLTIRFLAASAKTSAATINLDSKGAKALLRSNGMAIGSADIELGQVVEVVYISSAANGIGGWCMTSQTQMDSAGDIYADATVINNVYDLTIGESYQLLKGLTVRFLVPAGGGNQAAPTMTLNGGDPYAMKRADGKVFLGGELADGMLITAVFDGSSSWYISPWMTSNVGWSVSSTEEYSAAIVGITALYDGLHVLFNPQVTNSSAECTLDVNNLGAHQIVRWNGTTFLANELHARKWYGATYTQGLWYLDPIHIKSRTATFAIPTTATKIEAAHGLNRIPDFYAWYAVRDDTTGNDQGYVTGDIVPIFDISDGGEKCFAHWANSVNVGLSSKGTSALKVVPKTAGGALESIVPTKWDVYAICALIL